MGEWWKRVLGIGVATLLTAAGLVAWSPAHACACGAFLLPEGEQVRVSTENAIIGWDGEEERIVLSLDVEAGTNDAALLIPTPSPASVKVADPSSFREVERFTAPTVREYDLWWPEWLVREDLSESAPVAQPPEREVPIAGVDVRVVDAADAGGLEDWMTEHDYVMGDDVAAALVPYIQQGWHFLLVRLDVDSLTGRLAPLDISFETNQLIYPTRLSIAGGPVMIRTYVFAEHRMERADSMGGHLQWAGPVDQTDFTGQLLVDLARQHGFLTAWEQYFPDPRNQVDGDMVFAAASVDAPFERVYTEVTRHEILGAPAGPTLVFGGLITVGLGGGILSMVNRRRRSAAGSMRRA